MMTTYTRYQIVEVEIHPASARHYSGGDAILEEKIKAGGVTGWIVQGISPSSKSRPEGARVGIPAVQEAGMRFLTAAHAERRLLEWLDGAPARIDIVPLAQARALQEDSRKANSLDRHQIGAAIKAAREVGGLSQGDVAAALSGILAREVSREEISRWETGKRRPGAATLRLLEQAMGRKIELSPA